MDKGVKFVLDNFEKSLKLASKDEYKHLKGQIEFEYDLIKSMKKTGDAYDYFLKYADNSHQYADDFKVLNDNGLLSNEKISAYLLKNYPEEINNRTTIDDFEINCIYTNSDLYLMFNDFIRGIRYNSKKNIIAVITSHDSLYGDSWDNDILYYTGDGQEGDQTPTSAGNKALLSASKNNSKIYLFDKITTNKYYFRGEVIIAGSVRIGKEYDKNYKLRQVIKFPLKFVNQNTELFYSNEDREIINKTQKKKIDSLSREQLHELAKSRKVKSVRRIVETLYVERDQVVSKDTKNRARGFCDLCNEPAPFTTKDGPYLECHHVITIASGGPDVIYNTVALCPNCHRKMHSLNDLNDIKKLEKVILKYLLEDNDKENIIKYNSLFKD